VKPAFFTPAAEADVGEAFEWYEAQHPGLGPAFRRALGIAVAAAENQPEAHPVIHRNTRRVLLRKFPYALYYRILEENIAVVACIHGKRHPRIWRAR